MTSFAALAGGLCPTQEALALGLAAELGCPEGDARARIQALADGLPDAPPPSGRPASPPPNGRPASPPPNGRPASPRPNGRPASPPRGADVAASPRAQLDAVRGVVAGLAPRAGGTLLLPRALDGGGHPAVAVVAAAAVAARAGYGVEPAADGDGHLYLAHPDLDPPLIVDPGAPQRLLDGRSLGVDLYWRCAHETALCLLDHVIAQAARPGDLSTMLAASALRLALPLEDDARHGVAADHARLLARLN